MSKPMFAKRHYEAIARVMQSAHGHDWQTIREELSDLFKSDNSQFDRERFDRACIPGNNVMART